MLSVARARERPNSNAITIQIYDFVFLAPLALGALGGRDSRRTALKQSCEWMFK